MRAETRGYQHLDAYPEPEVLIARLDRVETYPMYTALREASYGALPGGTGVDVGCGHGRAVADLVERGIPAIGVDASQVIVDAAQRRFPAHRFTVADATDLPFASGTLQWYRAERLYQHLSDPAAAITEAKRVLAPGGRIVILDGDLDSIAMTSSDPHLSRRLLDLLVDDLPQGRIGTRILGLLTDAGFTDVTVSAHPMVSTDLDEVRAYFHEPAVALAIEAGMISAVEAEAWFADLDEHARTNRFLFAYIAFVTLGTAPSP